MFMKIQIQVDMEESDPILSSSSSTCFYLLENIAQCCSVWLQKLWFLWEGKSRNFWFIMYYHCTIIQYIPLDHYKMAFSWEVEVAHIAVNQLYLLSWHYENAVILLDLKVAIQAVESIRITNHELGRKFKYITLNLDRISRSVTYLESAGHPFCNAQTLWKQEDNLKWAKGEVAEN